MKNGMVPQTNRVNPRRPAWPIRFAAGFGLFALTAVLGGCDVLSPEVPGIVEKAPVEKTPESQDPQVITIPSSSDPVSCRGDFVPEESLPPSPTYVVEPVSPTPVEPAKEVSLRGASAP